MPGSSITFNAGVKNPGSGATYQWYINNDKAGPNSAIFTSSDVKEGDSVYCIFTSTHCKGVETVVSNKIPVHFGTGEAPVITIASTDNKVCPGETVTITVTVQNASDPVYHWFRNDVAVGNNESVYSYVPVSLDDRIRCDITTEGCAGGETSSEDISVGVFAMPGINVTPAESVVPPGTSVELNAEVNGTVSGYSWSSVEGLLNENTLHPTTMPVLNSHPVIFTAETPEGCRISDTAKIFAFVKMVMPNAFSPNGDGFNDVFRIPPNVTFQLNEFSVFNRWGKKIFTTADISKGWDGLNADVGIYVYMITGTLEGKRTVFKGTLMLAR
jgi:gliding motility-associated-like protein